MTASAHAPTLPDSKRWAALTFLLFAVLVVTLNQTVTAVSAPSIVSDLRTSVQIASLSTTLYLAIGASFLIPMGRIADHVGHKRVAAGALVLFGLASVIVAFAQEPWLLLTGRCMQGLSFAAVMPSSLAIINMEFPGAWGRRARAIAFGAWATVSGAAITVGPLWGGMWGETPYGWRAAFLVNLPIAAVLFVGLLATVHERHLEPTLRHADDRHHIDAPGVILLAIWIALLIVVLEEGVRLGWVRSLSSREGEVSTGVSIVPILFGISLVALAGLFVVEWRRNRRHRIAVVDMDLFRIGSYRNATIAVSLTYFGNFGLLFIVSIFTQFALGFSALASGITIAAAGIGILVGGQTASFPVHAVGPRRVVIASVFYQPVILVGAVPLISTRLEGWELAVILFLYGAGWGLSYSAFLNIAYRDVPDDLAAVASGSQLALRVLAGAVGTAVLGSVLSLVVVGGVQDQVRARDLDAAEARRLVREVDQTVSTPFARASPDVGAALDQLIEPGGPRGGGPVDDLYIEAFRIALLVAAGVSLVGVWFAYRIPKH